MSLEEFAEKLEDASESFDNRIKLLIVETARQAMNYDHRVYLGKILLSAMEKAGKRQERQYVLLKAKIGEWNERVGSN